MFEPTNRTTRRGPLRVVIVPTAVLIALIWTMVGCVYIPWFESTRLTGTKRDFRDTRQLAPAGVDPFDGHVTKADVVRLLGPPAIRSPNDRVWAYTLTAAHGVWVEPLCLNVTPGGQHAYALGLRFDDDGRLVHHYVAGSDIPPVIGLVHAFDFGPPFASDNFPSDGVDRAVGQLDDENGVERLNPNRAEPAPGEVRLSHWFALSRSR